MADFYKVFDPTNDIQNMEFPIESSLYSISSEADAILNNTKIYSIGPFKDSYIFKPDCFGSSTAGITPSGAFNSIAKTDFNRYGPQYFNSASGVYTIPASHTANVNVSVARVLEVSEPTKDSGIWPNSVTAVFSFNGASLTAVDNTSDSIGAAPELMTWGKLTDITNSNHCVGSVFYDDGLMLMHGGTGTVGSIFTDNSVTAMAFAGSITGSLTSSTTANTIVVESLQYRTYDFLTQTVYTCYLAANEFNYTSNPSAQGISFFDNPDNALVYITSLALLNNNDEILGVAKISPPLKKTKFIPRLILVTLQI